MYQADEADSDKDIWHACRHGNVAKVKELLTPDIIQRVDKEGRSLLHWAVDRNHLELTQWLLSQGIEMLYLYKYETDQVLYFYL